MTTATTMTMATMITLLAMIESTGAAMVYLSHGLNRRGLPCCHPAVKRRPRTRQNRRLRLFFA